MSSCDNSLATAMLRLRLQRPKLTDWWAAHHSSRPGRRAAYRPRFVAAPQPSALTDFVTVLQYPPMEVQVLIIIGAARGRPCRYSVRVKIKTKCTLAGHRLNVLILVRTDSPPCGPTEVPVRK